MGRVDVLAAKPVSCAEYLTVLRAATDAEIRDAAERIAGSDTAAKRRLAACRRELKRRGVKV